MTSIVKATEKDFQLLAEIGKISFLESHGSSAAMAEISKYINEKFNQDEFNEELLDLKNIYHIIYFDKQPTGYSKIILNVPNENIQLKNVTKLERLYLLKKFYDLKSGFELLKFNIGLPEQNKQAGM